VSVFRAVAATLLVLTNVTGLAAAPAAVQEVRIAEHRYVPEAITIRRGTTVRWVNDDDDPHTVTSDRDAFASPGMDKREAYTFTFDAPGTFPYHCALHPTMTATVVVK
jgi:plastocyanin